MMTDIGHAALAGADTLERDGGSKGWLNSLSTRLFLTCTVALVIAMGIVSVSVVMVFERYTTVTVGPSHQRRQAERLIRGIKTDPTGNIVSVDIPEVAAMWYVAFPNETKYRFLDGTGRVLFSSMRDGSPFPADGPFDPFPSRKRVRIGSQVFSVDTVPFQLHGKPLYVQTAITDHLQRLDAKDRLRAVFPIARIATVLLTIIFAIAMRWTFNVMFRPMRRISRDAATISPTNLGARLSLKQVPNEVLPLVTAFNAVLDRLEAGFKRQQAFLETTAHELQTPLTLIRAQLELGRRSGNIDHQALLGDVDHMSRSVRQLLHLAEVSEPHNYQPARLDIAAIAKDVRHYLIERAYAANVEIVIDTASWAAAEAQPVSGDESAFFMLLKNLVENAIKASPPFSMVTVTLSTDHIAVSDEGAGIAPEHLPHIFKRFWRAPNTGDEGAGLGLAICREIAAAHGWHLFVDMKVLHTRFVVAFVSAHQALLQAQQATLPALASRNLPSHDGAG